MLLHTLNALPSSAAFAQCLRLATAEDCILLLGDGVYAALEHSAGWRALTNSPARLCILEQDMLAAGIGAPDARLECVGYDGFVALSEVFPRQVAWY